VLVQNETALIYACHKEDISSVLSLLKLGADPNICTKVLRATWFILVVLYSCGNFGHFSYINILVQGMMHMTIICHISSK